MTIETNKPFSEVIESSLDTFVAQSWQWDVMPRFGSLVQVDSILGCVYNIRTGSSDPIRTPFPYKKTETELKAEQPQIFDFLKTTFHVKVLGYIHESTICYMIPPSPAKIHSFVQVAPKRLSADFFGTPDFLYLLFTAHNPIPYVDDLLLTIFKELAEQKHLPPKKLNVYCQRLSLLTGNDYRKIKLFLKRAERFV